LVFKICILFLALVFSSCSHEPLPILGEIPSFKLTDNFSQPFTEEDISGKIWVADLIFTTCAGPCPIMSTEMRTVHKTYLENENIRMVTITVNPDYDSPEVLTEYGKRYDADFSKWHFLTGEYENIQNLIANGFKMGDIEEIVFHSTRFALIDSNMKIRGYYMGTENEDVKKLMGDIKKLIKEIS
jgi:protein SCO1/2|tara:strand:- start:1409 stop:1963 length:555 start_codon:yes stop_codon:yes gene_type:complete